MYCITMTSLSSRKLCGFGVLPITAVVVLYICVQIGLCRPFVFDYKENVHCLLGAKDIHYTSAMTTTSRGSRNRYRNRDLLTTGHRLTSQLNIADATHHQTDRIQALLIYLATIVMYRQSLLLAQGHSPAPCHTMPHTNERMEDKTQDICVVHCQP